MVRSIIYGIVLLAILCSCAFFPSTTKSTPRNTDPWRELWECYEHFGSRKLGTLTVDHRDSTGTVYFSGIIANTMFSIQGIERRWDWDWGADGRSNSAIVVSPDGSGRYYNFRASNDGTAKPSELFQCERR